MAVTYGFYNSLNKDRMYNAEQMSSIFNGIITDGVFSTIGDALMTVAGTGMQVIVKPGRAWFNSTWTLNDAQLPLDVPAADVSLTRIDAVILEVNSAVATRANSIKVLKGTPSANPAKPALSATETRHQYALAYITVAAGATSITAANIEINVGKASCPFITSVLQQTDITDLFNQWDAEFTAWFENVQAQLSGNVAANLQKQIDEINENHLSQSTKLLLGLKSSATPDDAFVALYIGVDRHLVKVTVIDFDGTPKSGITIGGLAQLTGHSLVTDANGIVFGSIESSGPVSISYNGEVIEIKNVIIEGALTDVAFQLYRQNISLKYSNGMAAEKDEILGVFPKFVQIEYVSNKFSGYVKNPIIGDRYGYGYTSNVLDVKTKEVSDANGIVLGSTNGAFEIVINLVDGYQEIESSKTILLSKNVVKIDEYLLSSGQNGDDMSNYSSTGGRGGGQAVAKKISEIPITSENRSRVYTIGAPSHNGSATTSPSGSSGVPSIRGGIGGYSYASNVASGAHGAYPGESSSAHVFDDSNYPKWGGAGGGGGCSPNYAYDSAYAIGAKGGSPYGGKGGTDSDGEDATGLGGGGGGAGPGMEKNGSKNGGKGYRGAAFVRWHYN